MPKKYIYDHVHLVSSNPEKTADFYIKVFGARKGDVIITKASDISAEGTSIELFMEGTRVLIHPPRDIQKTEDAPKHRRGLEHFGLLTNDINGAITDCKKNGAKILFAPYVGISGNTIAFIEAPDNVVIELKQASI